MVARVTLWLPEAFHTKQDVSLIGLIATSPGHMNYARSPHFVAVSLFGFQYFSNFFKCFYLFIFFMFLCFFYVFLYFINVILIFLFIFLIISISKSNSFHSKFYLFHTSKNIFLYSIS